MTKTMKSSKRIPHFSSVQEAADFWDTHDAGDFLGELHEIQGVYDPSGGSKTTLSIRLDPGLKQQLSQVANQYDLSISSLVRMWVVDRLRLIAQ